MSPQELFDSHVHKAEEVSSRLCFFYAVAGALNYKDEAASEAKMALWKCCRKFDPNKQRMQIKLQGSQAKALSEEIILSCIFNYELPVSSPPTNLDPYKNFWISSLTRVRGSVLDYFRSERLIIKPVVTGELSTLTRATIKRIKNRIGVDDDDDVAREFGISLQALEKLKPTMLHQERFLSLDRALGDACGDNESGGGRESFYDIIPSNSRTDQGDEVQHTRYLILNMKNKASLTKQEEMAIDYFFSDAGYSKAEVAGLMQVTTSVVKNLIEDAILKLRNTSVLISV